MKKHFATLFYGIIPPDSFIFPWDESNTDWTECIASRHKLFPPQGKFTGNESKYEEYWKDKNKLINSLGIQIEPFGSEKNNKYGFAIKDSVYYSSQEFPELIDGYELTKKHSEWNALLENFCNILEIKEKIQPAWWLTSFSEMS